MGLALANRGEQTDSATVQKNLTVNQPVRVIVRATPERLEALRRGGTLQVAEGKDRAIELPAQSH